MPAPETPCTPRRAFVITAFASLVAPVAGCPRMHDAVPDAGNAATPARPDAGSTAETHVAPATIASDAGGVADGSFAAEIIAVLQAGSVRSPSPLQDVGGLRGTTPGIGPTPGRMGGPTNVVHHVEAPRLGAITTTGALGVPDAHRVVMSNLGRIRICHEYALRNQPTLGGTLTLVVRVAAAGNTDTAGITAHGLSPASPTLEACLLTSARSWMFPPGASVVTIPLTFATPG